MGKLQKATQTLQKPSVNTREPLVPCPVVPNKQNTQPTGAQAVVGDSERTTPPLTKRGNPGLKGFATSSSQACSVHVPVSPVDSSD